MKKLVFFIAAIVLFSCRQGDVVDKPDNLIDEDKMVNVLYDLSVLQGMRAQSREVLEDKNIDPKEYILRKYKIDSTTFVQNHRYYASRLKQYEKIQQRVKEKVDSAKQSITPEAAKAAPAAARQ